jgi:hypothetical protein
LGIGSVRTRSLFKNQLDTKINAKTQHKVMAKLRKLNRKGCTIPTQLWWVNKKAFSFTAALECV